jgi:Big-like domain-containing protein
MGADLFMRYAILWLTLLASLVARAQAQGFTGVTTWHNDNSRTGQNLNETILNPQNVNSSTFGKLFSYAVDGQIYAQPLYVPNVSIPGQGSHNVIYVATENDSVYAFDADGLMTTPLWQVSFLNPANGVTTVPCAKITSVCAVYPVVGITSTPVIDLGLTSPTLYLVAKTLENGTAVQRLHALNITNGQESIAGGVVIQGSVPGTGTDNKNGVVSFNSLRQGQRAGLLLSGGVIYIASGAGDHGWVFGYDEQNLTQLYVFSTTPNGYRGGIWGSQAGPAGDSQGNIFVATGDGTFDADSGGTDYGDSVIKLSSSLGVLDYFTPMDQLCRYTQDLDLGSGGPLLLPSQPGPDADELIEAGKGGCFDDLFGATAAGPIYLVNRDSMGQYSAQDNQDVETVAGSSHGYLSNPAYWQGPSGSYIYYSGWTFNPATTAVPLGDYLKMYDLSAGALISTPAAQSQNLFLMGSTPSVSANGSTDGVLWAIERQDKPAVQPGSQPAILYAYDASNVSRTLYCSALPRDQAGPANKFQVPTIANGKVYIGTQTELDVYGLLSTSVPVPAVSFSCPSLAFEGQLVGHTSPLQSVTLTNNAATSLNIGSILASGDYSLNATATSCPYNGGTLNAGASCTLDATFTPTQAGSRPGTIAVTDGASGSPQAVNLTGTGMATTTTTLSSGDNPSTYGQAVTFTATVTTGSGTPTGTVTFEENGSVKLGTTALSGGTAILSTKKTQLVAGTDSITATYNPDPVHLGSTSSGYSQTVKQASTTTALASSANPASVGQKVTFTATVKSPAGALGKGTVSFLQNGHLLQTVSLDSSGVATYTKSFIYKGQVAMTATYNESGDFLSSTSAVLTQTVQ